MSVCIFCGDHFGSLSQCLTLTDRYERVIYLIPAEDDRQRLCLERLQAAGLFQVIRYDYKHCSGEQNREELERELAGYFDRLLAEGELSVRDADEILVSNSGAYCPFELYLVGKGISYTLVEFAPGEFVSRRLLRSMAQYNDLSETYRALVLERGCVVGDNSFCACRVYAAGSRRDPALPGRANFHDPAALACLPEVRRDRILSAYPHIERESLSVLSVLLLPNSESLTRRALAGHGDYCTNLIAPYTLLTDLLGEKGGVLAVKPHPHGSFDFERYFEGAVILDKTFPVEFLYLIPGCRIGTLLSVETGGADKIAGTADRVVAAERYFMLNIHQMIGLRLAAALPALLPMRSLRFSSPQGEELAHVLNLLSRQIGMPEKAGLRPLSPGEETDVTVSFERPEGDVHRIHELSVLRRRTHPMSPVSEGRQSLYLTGELTEEELSGCRMHLELPYSRLKAELIPAGEET